MKPHKMSDQYAKVVQQAYEDGFVQGKIYEQSGRVSCGKTIPKEPQYLYVIMFDGNIDQVKLSQYARLYENEFIFGKIKLEVDDD